MKYLSFVVLVSISFFCQGQYYQKRDTVPQSKLRQITITLSPIVIQNGKYFFEGRRVKFEEMVLPLVSVHDQIVDHRMKVVRTMIDFRPVLYYAGFAYTTYLASHLPPTQAGLNTFLYSVIGIYVVRGLYDVGISLVKRSAINRYNDVVLMPTADITPGGGISAGFNVRF